MPLDLLADSYILLVIQGEVSELAEGARLEIVYPG
jgi:hypothetical protein